MLALQSVGPVVAGCLARLLAIFDDRAARSRKHGDAARAESLAAPPPSRGSHIVFSPVRVTSPGRFAPLSRNKSEMTPEGSVKASIRLLRDNSCIRGDHDQ